MQTEADKNADRLIALLDVALAEVRRGDGETALLALQEGVKAAERLPKRSDVICLPDRSDAVGPTGSD